MKKNLFHIIFPLLYLLLGIQVVKAQTDLVRWNNTNFTPTVVASNITATNITNAGGVSLSHLDWGNDANFFLTGNGGSWASGGLDVSRYIEFTISPNTGYKIDLDKFNFYYRAGWTPLTFQVRYSKDNFLTYHTAIGSTSGATQNWTSASASIASANPVMPGETLKIRIYAFDTGATVHIKRLFDNSLPTNYSQTPTITGTVSPAVTGDSTDLGITKTISNLTPSPGNNVVFTINVNNLGTNTASGTSVVDQLPPGFTYVSSTVSVGSYNPGQGIWTIGNLANNATATLQITAQILAAGPHTNTATVSHYGSDPVSGNNTASVTPSNVCAGCTHTVSGGVITVNSGDVYCLHSGSWSGGVIMNGGTICIAQGAIFNASYTTGLHSGRIINRGTVTAYPLSNSDNHTLHIENWGTFTSAYLQNFSGVIENYGILNINGQLDMRNGSALENKGQVTVNNIAFYGTTVSNYDEAEFNVTSGVNVYSGYWDNRLGGKVYFKGGNVNFTGDLDNSGYWEFERISSLSSSLNNYGQMKVYNAVSNISSTTYLTNDDLLEFIDVPEIEYNGPMLTNNGIITVAHATTGNFKMNQAINQVFNNGTIQVSGQFEQNAAGSLLVNSCTIMARHVFIGNGETRNNGLIWATGGAGNGLAVQGSASIFKNGVTGHVRGTDFINSGDISGHGSFYFIGNTNMNSAGRFVGDDASSPILFYDVSQTGNNIFDNPGVGSTVLNVIRPASMTLLDSTSYDCTAPPVVAGYPPNTLPFNEERCSPETIVLPLSTHVTPHAPVGGGSFTVQYSSTKLFQYNTSGNPTNNSTNLVIPGKGTFSVNTSTGDITFTPDSAFTLGVVEVEYRISNKRNGDPIVYPSGRTKIRIEFKNCTPVISRKVISNPMLSRKVKIN